MKEPSRPSLRAVVFAGSGFSFPSLSALIESQHLAGAVLPHPSHNGQHANELMALARQLELAKIPYLFCSPDMSSDLLERIQSWRSDMALIISFPWILPESWLNVFKFGTVNAHGSALPAYRGPAPLYWQIRNRETHSTLVLHRATKNVDGGDIILRADVPIDEQDTVQCLSNKMAHVCANQVLQLIAYLQAHDQLPEGCHQEQLSSDLNSANYLPGKYFSRRPKPKDNFINFADMRAEEISALCRASNAQPNAAWCYIHQVPIHIMQSTAVDIPTHGAKPGTVVAIGEDFGLVVASAQGALRLDVLAGADGVFSGLAFAERFQLDVGQVLTSISKTMEAF